MTILSNTRRAFRANAGSVLGLAAALPVVYYSLSRTTYALIPVVLLAAACVIIAKRSQLAAFGIITVAGLMGLAAAIALRDELLGTLSEVDDLRGGSSASRGEVYGTTLSYVLSHPFPLLGYGVKPREEGLVASVGTHSTVLGLAFRAGLLAAGLPITGLHGVAIGAQPVQMGLARAGAAEPQRVAQQGFLGPQRKAAADEVDQVLRGLGPVQPGGGVVLAVGVVVTALAVGQFVSGVQHRRAL